MAGTGGGLRRGGAAPAPEATVTWMYAKILTLLLVALVVFVLGYFVGKGS
jgi:hypothetical protein